LKIAEKSTFFYAEKQYFFMWKSHSSAFLEMIPVKPVIRVYIWSDEKKPDA
jgi:hypothetical protein